MNILTKICIVILVVLNLVISGVFIKFVSESANYKDLYNVERQNKLAAEQTTKHYALALETSNQMHKAESEKNNKALADAKAFIADLQKEIAKLQGEVVTLQSDKQSLLADTTRLTLNEQKSTQITETIRLQLQKANEDLQKLNEEINALTVSLKEAVARADRQEKVVRLLREQLHEERERIKTLIASGGKEQTGDTSGATVTADVEITGNITSVDQNIAAIDVGSAKGLKNGMKLIVYRNDKFVAYLRIEEVDVDSAAGVIEKKQLDPIVGDKATTKLD